MSNENGQIEYTVNDPQTNDPQTNDPQTTLKRTTLKRTTLKRSSHDRAHRGRHAIPYRHFAAVAAIAAAIAAVAVLVLLTAQGVAKLPSTSVFVCTLCARHISP